MSVLRMAATAAEPTSGVAALGWLLPLIVRDPMTANTKGSHSTSTQTDALEGAQKLRTLLI